MLTGVTRCNDDGDDALICSYLINIFRKGI
jgi:hypothetical protein